MLALEILKLGRDLIDIAHPGSEVHEALDPAADLGEPHPALLHASSLLSLAHDLQCLRHDVGNRVLVEHLIADGVQDATLQVVYRDAESVPALARPAIAPPRTPVPSAAIEIVEGTTALLAHQEAREKPPGARVVLSAGDAVLARVGAHHTGAVGDSLLDLAPEILRDDPPALILATDPLALGSLVAPPPARLVVLHPLGPAPDQLAVVERVPQHLADRGRRPGGPPLCSRSRRRNALGVQPMRDGLDAVAVGVQREDPHDDLRLLGNDNDLAALPALLRLVAVGDRAGGEPPLHAPPQASPRVVSELREVLLVEDAHDLRTDILQVEASGHFDRAPAMGSQPIRDPAQVLLIPRQTRPVEAEEHIPLVDPSD